ncbi:sodium/glutamate symporter [Vibrio variabilis]|uniref:Sodium/glutamate symporter n=1 Tax=Vibrio variabilis TaxID=990271 RepID=A0ABQ0JQ63_9VIBR|nr:sodium/glutamate symporter [Vibrio variabilis]
MEYLGLQLPLFVTCLFAGIILSNIVPHNYPRITGTTWPANKPAVALIADMSLGAFLAMSLMSMQLWTLVDLAGPIFAILGAQFIVAILVNLFIIFLRWEKAMMQRLSVLALVVSHWARHQRRWQTCQQ